LITQSVSALGEVATGSAAITPAKKITTGNISISFSPACSYENSTNVNDNALVMHVKSLIRCMVAISLLLRFGAAR
jgi:hypothetical protein